MRLDQSGHITVGPPVDVGDRAEDDIFPLVLGLLSASGTTPVIKTAHNDRGEDRVVRQGDVEITIQMTTVGPAAFWKAVASAPTVVEADLETVASWVNDAIARKAALYSPAQKRDMLLALDMRHLGVLVHPALVDAYIRKYDAPDGYGLGSVWLIGPADDHCIRLGHGRW